MVHQEYYYLATRATAKKDTTIKTLILNANHATHYAEYAMAHSIIRAPIAYRFLELKEKVIIYVTAWTGTFIWIFLLSAKHATHYALNAMVLMIKIA
jgi:hypothetical protein